MNYFCSVIIPAAGQGRRMGTNINKQFLCIGGKPILAHTVGQFENCDLIKEIIIVTAKDEIQLCKEQIIQKYGFSKVVHVVEGGKERQESVYKGLEKVSKRAAIVLIHDGARPFIESSEIEKSIQEALVSGACAVGVKVKDTIKVVDPTGKVIETPDRNMLWSIQTPQTFQYNILWDAHTKARNENFVGTDDAMLVEKLGYPLKVIEGSYSNIKITTPEDLMIGEVIFRQNC